MMPDYQGSRLVDQAVTALSAFGGHLTRAQAAKLLPMWSHFRELTADECTAVLDRIAGIASVRIEEPGNSGPGW